MELFDLSDEFNQQINSYLTNNLIPGNEFEELYNELRNKVLTRDILSAIRIYLTEDCNANCSFCFNSKKRTPANFIDPQKLEILNNTISDQMNPNLSVRVMGGEPTLHPEFKEIYSSLMYHYSSIKLFTNALNDEITKLKPRRNDLIVYNFSLVNKSFPSGKFIPERKFKRAFETMVACDTNIDELKRKIEVIVNRLSKLFIDSFTGFALTLNLTENIDSNRIMLNSKLEEIVNFLNDINIGYWYDHRPPICFFEPRIEKLILNNPGGFARHCLCTPDDSFNVYSDFTLYYCNQFPLRIGNVFRGDDIMDLSEIKEKLIHAHTIKLMTNYLAGCKDCEHWLKMCNGGCWKHRTVVNT
jgi:radical SAM protein with 4Fe4S-binding SPASM domain